MKRFDPTEESNAWQLFVCLTSGADAAKEKKKKSDGRASHGDRVLNGTALYGTQAKADTAKVAAKANFSYSFFFFPSSFRLLLPNI